MERSRKLSRQESLEIFKDILSLKGRMGKEELLRFRELFVVRLKLIDEKLKELDGRP